MDPSVERNVPPCVAAGWDNMRAKDPKERMIHDRRKLLNALAVYRRGHGPDLPPEEMELVVTGLEQRIARRDAMIEDEEA